MQSDPIGLDGGINAYAYVRGMLCKQQERELYNKLKRPKKKKLSKKEAADDCPSWAKQDGGPLRNEQGKDYAKRLLDEKYGPDGWAEGPGTEYNQIRKWADRAFEPD